MSLDPHSLLQEVHPDLCKVLRRCAQQPVGFQVVYGLRTLEAQQKLKAQGKSQTLHSRHLPGQSGFACAVDVEAIVDGKLTWAPGEEEEVFGQIAKQMFAASNLVNVPLQWGGADIGAWTPGVKSTFRDWDHFQLPWKEYP